MTSLSIGKRLALGFALVLLLATAITAIGLWRMEDSARATREMMELPLTKERLINDWYNNVNAGIRRTTAIAKSSDPSLVTYFAEDVAAATKVSGELQKAISEKLTSDQERTLFDRIGEMRQQYLAARDEINRLKKNDQAEEANTVLDTKAAPAAKAYMDAMLALQTHQRKAIDLQAEQINTQNHNSRNMLIALGLLMLGLGSASAWLITRSITLPLNKALETAQKVAAGDLSHHVEVTNTQDETGVLLQALKEMQQRLAQVVGHVRGNAESVATASAQIAQGNMDLSARTENQAAALQQTAATMDELSSTVRNNADNARQASQLAVGASGVATKGGEVVGQVVNTMRDIDANSKKIADIISVIDGIAFQTNILALNAAVEAARAGEQGRGFAVVAGEVRSLAQRSAQAAREINSLITTSVEKVEQGTALVDKAGTTMGEIVNAIQRVSDIVAEISAASTEQSNGVTQVGQAVTQMDQATQQNAALVEESAAAAASLKGQARQLVEAVAVFRLSPA